MKSLYKLSIFSAILFASGILAADVVIKQVPMTVNDIAGKNGQEVYDQLCAVCHGTDGKGDGPAAQALANPVPDLTQLGTGVNAKYSNAQLKHIIAGRSRTVHEDIVGMPLWEVEFQYVHRNWNGQPRTSYARSKIHSLTEYVEGLTLAATD
jgi:mono/diheme cytochrome c family protein